MLDGITVENETGTMTLPVQYCRGLTIRDLTCAAANNLSKTVEVFSCSRFRLQNKTYQGGLLWNFLN